MTLCLVLKTREGIVAAADPKSTSLAPDDVRRMPHPYHWMLRTRLIGGRVFVAIKSTPELFQAIEKALADFGRTPGDANMDAMLPVLKETVVAVRAETIRRYRSMFQGIEDPRYIPSLHVLLAEVGDAGPRILYISENGDVEDHTESGHYELGASEIYGLLHIKDFPLEDLPPSHGLLVAYSVLRNAADSKQFDVDAPPAMWRIGSDGSGRRLTEADLIPLEAAHENVRSLVRQRFAEVAQTTGA